jgi:hypothetical protein
MGQNIEREIKPKGDKDERNKGRKGHNINGK